MLHLLNQSGMVLNVISLFIIVNSCYLLCFPYQIVHSVKEEKLEGKSHEMKPFMHQVEQKRCVVTNHSLSSEKQYSQKGVLSNRNKVLTLLLLVPSCQCEANLSLRSFYVGFCKYSKPGNCLTFMLFMMMLNFHSMYLCYY